MSSGRDGQMGASGGEQRVEAGHVGASASEQQVGTDGAPSQRTISPTAPSLAPVGLPPTVTGAAGPPATLREASAVQRFAYHKKGALPPISALAQREILALKRAHPELEDAHIAAAVSKRFGMYVRAYHVRAILQRASGERWASCSKTSSDRYKNAELEAEIVRWVRETKAREEAARLPSTRWIITLRRVSKYAKEIGAKYGVPPRFLYSTGWCRMVLEDAGLDRRGNEMDRRVLEIEEGAGGGSGEGRGEKGGANTNQPLDIRIRYEIAVVKHVRPFLDNKVVSAVVLAKYGIDVPPRKVQRIVEESAKWIAAGAIPATTEPMVRLEDAIAAWVMREEQGRGREVTRERVLEKGNAVAGKFLPRVRRPFTQQWVALFMRRYGLLLLPLTPGPSGGVEGGGEESGSEEEEAADEEGGRGEGKEWGKDARGGEVGAGESGAEGGTGGGGFREVRWRMSRGGDADGTGAQWSDGAAAGGADGVQGMAGGVTSEEEGGEDSEEDSEEDEDEEETGQGWRDGGKMRGGEGKQVEVVVELQVDSRHFPAAVAAARRAAEETVREFQRDVVEEAVFDAGLLVRGAVGYGSQLWLRDERGLDVRGRGLWARHRRLAAAGAMKGRGGVGGVGSRGKGKGREVPEVVELSDDEECVPGGEGEAGVQQRRESGEEARVETGEEGRVEGEEVRSLVDEGGKGDNGGAGDGGAEDGAGEDGAGEDGAGEDGAGEDGAGEDGADGGDGGEGDGGREDRRGEDGGAEGRVELGIEEGVDAMADEVGDRISKDAMAKASVDKSTEAGECARKQSPTSKAATKPPKERHEAGYGSSWFLCERVACMGRSYRSSLPTETLLIHAPASSLGTASLDTQGSDEEEEDEEDEEEEERHAAREQRHGVGGESARHAAGRFIYLSRPLRRQRQGEGQEASRVLQGMTLSRVRALCLVVQSRPSLQQAHILKAVEKAWGVSMSGGVLMAILAQRHRWLHLPQGLSLRLLKRPRLRANRLLEVALARWIEGLGAGVKVYWETICWPPRLASTDESRGAAAAAAAAAAAGAGAGAGVGGGGMSKRVRYVLSKEVIIAVARRIGPIVGVVPTFKYAYSWCGRFVQMVAKCRALQAAAARERAGMQAGLPGKEMQGAAVDKEHVGVGRGEGGGQGGGVREGGVVLIERSGEVAGRNEGREGEDVGDEEMEEEVERLLEEERQGEGVVGRGEHGASESWDDLAVWDPRMDCAVEGARGASGAAAAEGMAGGDSEAGRCARQEEAWRRDFLKRVERHLLEAQMSQGQRGEAQMGEARVGEAETWENQLTRRRGLDVSVVGAEAEAGVSEPSAAVVVAAVRRALCEWVAEGVVGQRADSEEAREQVVVVGAVGATWGVQVREEDLALLWQQRTQLLGAAWQARMRESLARKGGVGDESARQGQREGEEGDGGKEEGDDGVQGGLRSASTMQRLERLLAKWVKGRVARGQGESQEERQKEKGQSQGLSCVREGGATPAPALSATAIRGCAMHLLLKCSMPVSMSHMFTRQWMLAFLHRWAINPCLVSGLDKLPSSTPATNTTTITVTTTAAAASAAAAVAGAGGRPSGAQEGSSGGRRELMTHAAQASVAAEAAGAAESAMEVGVDLLEWVDARDVRALLRAMDGEIWRVRLRVRQRMRWLSSVDQLQSQARRKGENGARGGTGEGGDAGKGQEGASRVGGDGGCWGDLSGGGEKGGEKSGRLWRSGLFNTPCYYDPLSDDRPKKGVRAGQVRGDKQRQGAEEGEDEGGMEGGDRDDAEVDAECVVSGGLDSGGETGEGEGEEGRDGAETGRGRKEGRGRGEGGGRRGGRGRGGGRGKEGGSGKEGGRGAGGGRGKRGSGGGGGKREGVRGGEAVTGGEGEEGGARERAKRGGRVKSGGGPRTKKLVGVNWDGFWSFDDGHAAGNAGEGADGGRQGGTDARDVTAPPAAAAAAAARAGAATGDGAAAAAAAGDSDPFPPQPFPGMPPWSQQPNASQPRRPVATATAATKAVAVAPTARAYMGVAGDQAGPRQKDTWKRGQEHREEAGRVGKRAKGALQQQAVQKRRAEEVMQQWQGAAQASAFQSAWKSLVVHGSDDEGGDDGETEDDEETDDDEETEDEETEDEETEDEEETDDEETEDDEETGDEEEDVIEVVGTKRKAPVSSVRGRAKVGRQGKGQKRTVK
ncbi:unnamed protein product [Closterium sp. Naga37s-1]|nr:unnamed protein product [Closterium sp. Naga37s-1]